MHRASVQTLGCTPIVRIGVLLLFYLTQPFKIVLTGGFEFDGGTEIGPLKPVEIQQAAEQVLQQGIKSIVLSGVFSPGNPAQEEAAEAIIKQHLSSGRPHHVHPSKCTGAEAVCPAYFTFGSPCSPTRGRISDSNMQHTVFPMLQLGKAH